MIALRGIYKQGMIELVEKPEYTQPIEVLIIFPDDKKSKIKKVGGKFKNYEIDYEAIENELKETRYNSINNLLKQQMEL